MNVEEWAADRTGKCIDLDGAFGCQCVDLADDWANVRGYPLPLVEGAKDLAGRSISGWEWETAGTAPPGSLMVWNDQIGEFGHVSVMLGVEDAGHFTSLDQNWYSPSDQGSPAARVYHTYYGVAGWFVPQEDDVSTQDVLDALNTGTGDGQPDWASTNKQILHLIQDLLNKVSAIEAALKSA